MAETPSRTDATGLSGFDFTLHMRRLCGDLIARLPELTHVDLERVAVCFSQTRSAARHGLYASLTPMRFEGGRDFTIRRGRRYTAQRYLDPSGREILYILRFYLPRFFELAHIEKLTTVIHELWHISPAFDGDIRRHDGRCFAHGSSQARFDALARQLADRWLADSPPDEMHDFLRLSYRDLVGRYGWVFGTKLPKPKLIPLN